MLETVCELSAVSRAIAARDNAPLVLIASITTRRLCDLACSRLVPEMAFFNFTDTRLCRIRRL